MALRPVSARSFLNACQMHWCKEALQRLFEAGFTLADQVVLDIADSPRQSEETGAWAADAKIYIDLISPSQATAYLITVIPKQTLSLSVHLDQFEEPLEQYVDNEVGWQLLVQELLQRERPSSESEQ